MADNPLWRQVALASAKWYAPLNPQLLESCVLRPLYREADSSDEVPIDLKPTIAFPAALPPKSILGKSPDDIRGLFFAPLVVRLHYVAQLSTTSLRANIDAKHCRLSHALGTLCILSALVEILVTRMKSEAKIDACCLPSPDEIVASFTYAALHDAFQGPFGHALDAIREELVGGLHANRRLDKTLLNFISGSALNFQEGRLTNPPAAIESLCALLSSVVAEPNGIDISWLLRWIHDASLADHASLSAQGMQRRNELGWLYELLEGPIDADRWDYLWRDTLHLGFTRDNHNMAELLREFWADVSIHWDGRRSRLAVGEGLAKRLGSHFFMLRKNLYKNVYENPEKRIIDSILVRCIYLGLLSHMPVASDWAARDQKYFEFLLNLVHTTDSDLLFILEQAENPLCALHARELRTYPAVRVFWEEVVRDEEAHSVLAFNSEKLKDFAYHGVMPPPWVSADGEAEGEEFLDSRSSEVAESNKVWYALDQTWKRLKGREQVSNVVALGAGYLASLLLHCSILPKRPARILQFERVLWKLVSHRLRVSSPLVVDKITKSVGRALADAYALPLAVPDEQVRQLLSVCPPFVVSFPWIPVFSEAAMQEMSRDPAGSRIYVRSGEGRDGDRRPADLMPTTRNSETYIAVAGYSLHATDGLSPLERETLENVARGAIISMLNYGCCLALPRGLVKPECDVHILTFLLDKIDEAKG